MSRYDLALQIATQAHDGQKDKAGKDYIEHPVYVASKFSNEELKIVAILHDVLEDTYVSLADLEKYGFSKSILKAVDVITRKPNQRYKDYIALVKRDPLASSVKIEDIKHNMDLSRIPKPNRKDISRVNKYKKSLRFLAS